MTDQRCGTCRHWKLWPRWDPVTNMDQRVRLCVGPAPSWITGMHGNQETLPHHGQDCDLWEATDE